MSDIDLITKGKGQEIARIFFGDWYSLKEASIIYNPELPQSSRNNRTTAYYFYKFKELDWLEEEEITKYFPRKSKKGKKEIYPNECKRYRFNSNPFFSYCKNHYKKIEFSPEEKKYIEEILNYPSHRKAMLKEYPDRNIIDMIIFYFFKYFVIYPFENVSDFDNKVHTTLQEQIIKQNKSINSKKRKERFDLEDKEYLKNYGENENHLKFKRAEHFILKQKENPEIAKQINIKFKNIIGL